jgi:hypothetical protein
MAAGLGFKTFTTGEVLTSADVNGYLMQGVLVFASAAARNAAITSPEEGQFAFTKDTNGLWYYDGAAWVASGATGDIEGVTAGVGITGGGTSGAVTVGIQDGTTTQKGAVQLENSTSSTSTTTAAVPASVKSAYDLASGKMTNPLTTTGDTIYSSSGTTPARLGIGSTGQVLTVAGGVPSWATPASSKGSFSLLSTTSLSGSTTTISGLSGYDKMFFVISNLSAAAAGNYLISVRLNTDTGANYTFAGAQALVANNYSQSFITQTSIKFGETPNGAADQMHGFISLTGSNSTGGKMITMNSAGNNSGFQGYGGGGFYNASAVISSISFIITGSTFDLGTIYTYGSVA